MSGEAHELHREHHCTEQAPERIDAADQLIEPSADERPALDAAVRHSVKADAPLQLSG